MKRGRPFEIGNQVGSGRPKGSRNKRSLFAEHFFDKYAPPILERIGIRAVAGDQKLQLALLPYFLPQFREERNDEEPCDIGPLSVDVLERLVDRFEGARVVEPGPTPLDAEGITEEFEGQRTIETMPESEGVASAILTFNQKTEEGLRENGVDHATDESSAA